MKYLETIALIMTISFLSSCASSSPQALSEQSVNPAYSSTKLDEGIYRISFAGESMTTSAASADFARLSGAETALRHGFKYFYINKFFVTSGSPPGALPTNTLIIRCLNERPADAPSAVHDAAQLCQKLSHLHSFS